MFRFSIRDVLWLTVVVALSVCLWIDHRSLARLSAESQADKERLQNQRDALILLTIEKLKLEDRLRKRQLLTEAEPGVYYLGPERPSASGRGP